MSNFLIGRQPIYDRSRRLFGYELLYRDPHPQPTISGTRATEQLVVDALLELGLNTLSGGTRVFINLTRENLLSELVYSLPPSQVVIEILETVAVDDALVKAVQNLVRAGYTIALDDFVFQPHWEPLIRLAAIIKLDFRAQPPEELNRLVQRLRPFPAELLAEKIETQEEFQYCLKLGCTYFQGYYFHRPQLVRGKRAGTANIAKLKLLAEIQRLDIDIQQLVAIIGTDPGLSYKLLKFINSAKFALPRRVQSIEQAVVLLGIRELRRWATLLALSEAMGRTTSQSLHLSLSRGKMCQLLAQQANLDDADGFFLVGLLSTLEQSMQMPMTEVLRDLPLAEPIVQGLTGRGIYGKALRCVIAYETWQLDQAVFCHLKPQQLSALYLQSLQWAQQTLSQLQ